jgi:BirA family transcriptional regulator, biotin operon repressor / biotin---[acetyl-CoA-carboxylase] ligase
LSKNTNKLSPYYHEIGSPFIELQQVDSTNNYATGLVHAGMAQEGTVVFAHEQTRGKGQRNKTWKAQKGANIIMSAVVQPRPLPLSRAFLFSMATANALHRFFSPYAGSETKVKWPNDLYWRDRKAGGILIENIIMGSEWNYAIVGLGININQVEFPGLKTRAVSLRQITGREFDVLELARELCHHLQQSYALLESYPEVIRDEYHRNLYKLNEPVRLRQNSRVFETTIKGVTPLGDLVTFSTVEERFSMGEVEWVI